MTSGRPANHKAIFWIGVLALFTAAIANAIRNGASEAMKLELFDPVDPAHSGELFAAATRVWRDLFASPEDVTTEGFAYIRNCWEQAQ